MAEIELKPCPFCGAKKELEIVYIGEKAWMVHCAMCGCSIDCSDTGEEAIEAWNRRNWNEK